MSDSSKPTIIQFTELLGVELTHAQRVLCAVAFDGVQPKKLRGESRAIARQLFGDVDVIPPEARKVLAAVIGARSGKTYILAALYSLWRALVADLGTLAPGETATALIVAPDQRLARLVVKYALGAAKGCPSIAPLVGSVTADAFAIRRPDGVVMIECLPATRGGSAVRGRSLVSAVLDEAAFFRDESNAVNDRDVFSAAVARVMKGGMVVIDSTPWIEAGLLHELFSKNRGAPRTAISVHAPTGLMRDDEATRDMVALERERDPENARREFDAEFGSSESTLLDPTDVDTAARGHEVTPPRAGVSYRAGGDLAVRHDFSVLTIGHRQMDDRPHAPPLDMISIDFARHWAPSFLGSVLKQKIDVDELETSFTASLTRYRAPLVLDGWGFDFFESRMQKRGIKSSLASMAPASQARRASLMASLFKQGRVVLPRGNSELLKQLKAIRVLRTAGGQMRFAAPDRRGSHDDYPKALMLLIEALQDAPAAYPDDVVTRIEFGRDYLGRINSYGQVAFRQVVQRDGSVRLVRLPPAPGTPAAAAATAERHRRLEFTPEEVADGTADRVLRGD